MKTLLHQRGRASLDFAAVVGMSIGKHSRQAMSRLKAGALADMPLAVDLDERATQVLAVADSDPEFRASDLCREWYCLNHGKVAAEAFNEAATEITPQLDQLNVGATSLDPNPSMSPPKYWSDHWIHRTHGGWDGHPYMGFIMAELVHGYLVRKIIGSDLSEPRREVAEICAALAPRRVLELGCGPGQYTRALATAIPTAELFACDISLRQLEEARRRLNRDGQSVKLLRRAGEETGLPANSIDLVTAYAILHELPRSAIEGIYKEAFRVLAPGGELIFADVPPYAQLKPLLQWQVDFAASREGEPFWRESATMDMTAALARIGFVDIKCYGLRPGDYPFPWMTRARKPQ